MPRLIAALLAALVAFPAAAQTSPYAQMQVRPIKALSAEESADLLQGRGMGLSLAAELNGHPGPMHALELAESLGLSAEQRQVLEALVAAMRAEAKALGEEIVAGEAALDALFTAGPADAATVAAKAEELGRLRGRLRAVHLGAHVATRGLLDAGQVQRYAELRGYHAGMDGHRHRH